MRANEGNEKIRRLGKSSLVGLCFVVFTIAGCGGGGGGGGGSADAGGSDGTGDGSDGTSGVETTGYFKDANVSGLSYVSGEQSGTTGASGQFTFESGSDVTFSIGGVELGTTGGSEVLTPLELSSNGNLTDSEVLNRVRFLMMLDSDGDVSNGIQISSAVQTAAENWAQLDFSSASFDTENAVTSIVSDVSSSDSRIADLPTTADAQNHMEETLRCITAGAFKGTFSGDDSGSFGFLVDAGNGSVTGVAYSQGDEALLQISGSQAVSLDTDRSFASGTVHSGATFSGNFTDPNSVSGTWNNSLYNASGSFSGSRIGGALDATYRYTGQYGGSDYGLFTFDVDVDGNVTGVVYSVMDDETDSLSGTLSDSTLSATTGSGSTVSGSMDINAGTVTGSWSTSDGAGTGTFNGSGCTLNAAGESDSSGGGDAGDGGGSNSPSTITVDGSWTSSGGRNANSADNRHYEIVVAESGTVTVDLTSGADPYLFLLDDSGNVLYENDDGGDGNDSQISAALDAGTYTLVAATYYLDVADTFTISGNNPPVDSITRIDIADNQIGGTVRDADTGLPLENVLVKVPLESQDVTTYTDANGDYTLPITPTELPESFAMTYSLTGYVPEAKNITQNSGTAFILNTTLEPESLSAVVLEIEPLLHHLGDGGFSGTVNSQFQTATEGLTYSKTFTLTSEHLAAVSGEVTLLAKGLQNANELRINGTLVDYMDTSPSDGSFGDLSYSISPSVLQSGNNTLSITAAANTSTDYDDFEFSNVILRLSY